MRCGKPRSGAVAFGNPSYEARAPRSVAVTFEASRGDAGQFPQINARYEPYLRIRMRGDHLLAMIWISVNAVILAHYIIFPLIL